MCDVRAWFPCYCCCCLLIGWLVSLWHLIGCCVYPVIYWWCFVNWLLVGFSCVFCGYGDGYWVWDGYSARRYGVRYRGGSITSGYRVRCGSIPRLWTRVITILRRRTTRWWVSSRVVFLWVRRGSSSTWLIVRHSKIITGRYGVSVGRLKQIRDNILALITLKYFYINHEDQRVFLQFEITISTSVSTLRFTWISMLWVDGYYKYFNFFSARIVFILQNLTSADVRFWRIKTVPVLKGLIL